MGLARVAWLALIAGCYSPRFPEGAPCDSTQQCPAPQTCVLDRCSLHDARPDAEIVPDAAEEIDAAIPIDAAPDAMVLPCTADGLVGCGTATLFTCGGHCWVRCSNGASRINASTTCVGWQGALGQIDDDAEQTCVASRVGNDSWIGLVQSDAATVPSEGWAWNTDATPVVFTNWQAARPDDRDGSENRAEQCGMIQGDAFWDDVACTQQHAFFCER